MGGLRRGIRTKGASRITTNIDIRKSPFQLKFGRKNLKIKNLRDFGEIVVVTKAKKSKIQSKLTDRGTVCMLVDCVSNHENNMYSLLNTKTKQIIQSTDLIWLNKLIMTVIITREMCCVADNNTVQRRMY